MPPNKRTFFNAHGFKFQCLMAPHEPKPLTQVWTGYATNSYFQNHFRMVFLNNLFSKPCNFNSVLGSPTFRRCVLFPRCWWNQWDSSPIHHRYSNTNSMWVHAIILSQCCHFYGCRIWHKWHEIPSFHLDGVWWSSHTCPFSMDRYK